MDPWMTGAARRSLDERPGARRRRGLAPRIVPVTASTVTLFLTRGTGTHGQELAAAGLNCPSCRAGRQPWCTSSPGEATRAAALRATCPRNERPSVAYLGCDGRHGRHGSRRSLLRSVSRSVHREVHAHLPALSVRRERRSLIARQREGDPRPISISRFAPVRAASRRRPHRTGGSRSAGDNSVPPSVRPATSCSIAAEFRRPAGH